VLVAAVFDAFFRTYQERIQDLLRIASGGTGQLPRGAIHPDLVTRLGDEAASVAQATLRMCIRAFDYLPPVDVSFGDYLRALVTADFELNPQDSSGLRRAMIESFRERGIYPDGVNSLSGDELRWPRVEPSEAEGQSGTKLESIIDSLASNLIQEASNTSRNSSLDTPAQPAPDDEDDPTPQSSSRGPMYSWGLANSNLLRLSPRESPELAGFHSVFRVGRDGQLLVEVVLQFTQKAKDPAYDFGGVPLRGGTTVVVQANGKIRYVISKPLPSSILSENENKRAEERVNRQKAFVNDFDERDSFHIWNNEEFSKQRLKLRMNLAHLHGGLSE
jgi:hypothetical protein